ARRVRLTRARPLVVRLAGDREPMGDDPVLSEFDLESVLDEITALSPGRREAFEETGDLDIAFSHPTLPRFRVNGFRQRGAISFAFRVIPSQIPTFTDLGLPAGVRRLAGEHRGLILVTGPTGSGKTTSLPAMLDHINRQRLQP